MTVFELYMLIQNLRDKGYTEIEIEKILFRIADDRMIDAAMRLDTE